MEISAKAIVDGSIDGIQIWQLQVLGPDNTPIKAYSRKIIVRNNKLTITIPFPLNARPGKRTIKIRDAATGLISKSVIEVRK